MRTDGAKLIDGELSEVVIGSFYSVYNELGTGFIESVYENALAMDLRDSGVQVAQQAPLTTYFRGRPVGEFRIDLLVNERLIVELKAVSQLMPVHEVQLVNYLKASRIRVGLLLNFGPKPQFRRRVFDPFKNDPSPSASIRVENNVQ